MSASFMSLNFILVASCAISLVCSIASIALRYWETPPEAMRRIATLEVDLQETIDTFTRWMKRENVRRARDKAEELREGETPDRIQQETRVDSNDRKAQIRRKIAQQQGLR